MNIITKFSFLYLPLLLLSINGCSSKRGDEAIQTEKEKSAFYFDKDLKLTREEFEKKMVSGEERSKKPSKKDTTIGGSSIPSMSRIIIPPEEPQIGEGRLISLTVNDDVPVKDVLLELSRLADIEIELDPNITGRVILSVKDRPLEDVITKICRMANLRYSIHDSVLKVEVDTPYVKSYSVDFLDQVRSNTGSISISTKTGGDNLNSGAETKVESSSDGNIWESVVADIKSMLGQNGATTKDPNTYLTVNQQAGILTVSATQRQHKNINKYITKVARDSSAQVLIEAKILEVNLKDEFRTGINWSKLGGIGSGSLTQQLNDAVTPSFAISISSSEGRGSLNGVLSLVETFGVVKALSSPRINAMNNQQAILTFAENKVYFEVAYDDSSTTADSTTTTTTSISSTLKTVPLGVIMSLQPSINLETQEIVMNIRPTISSSNSVVNDPAVSIVSRTVGGDAINSAIPVVQVKELDSILRIKSGEVMVIGGLMEERTEKEEIGVPFLKNIPILGYMFKSYKDIKNVVETVIFIRATIVQPSGKVGNSDQNFYNDFARDPSPLNF